MTCRRCKLGIDEAQPHVQIAQHIAPPDGRKYYLDGDAIGSVSAYHWPCVPPNLFHKFAGSLPAGQSPGEASLFVEQHATRGGLSSRRGTRRRRFARRVRYRRTATRRQAEEDWRAARQEMHTDAMTADGEFERLGRLALCHCPTTQLAMTRIAKEYGLPQHERTEYFLTSNGYCRYCGRWNWRHVLRVAGPVALEAEIAKLDEHTRNDMLEITGDLAAAG